jgi:hypothetical protein
VRQLPRAGYRDTSPTDELHMRVASGFPSHELGEQQIAILCDVVLAPAVREELLNRDGSSKNELPLERPRFREERSRFRDDANRMAAEIGGDTLIGAAGCGLRADNDGALNHCASRLRILVISSRKQRGPECGGQHTSPIKQHSSTSLGCCARGRLRCKSDVSRAGGVASPRPLSRVTHDSPKTAPRWCGSAAAPSTLSAIDKPRRRTVGSPAPGEPQPTPPS